VFWTRESVKNPSMPLQAVIIIASFVTPDPLNQLCQHGRLVGRAGKLFGFPKPAMAMSDTDLNSWIQEPQLGAEGKRGLDQIAVTTLDNPSLVALDEIVQQPQTHLQGLSLWAFIPGNLI
jgi:hypothetical protein